MKKRGKQHVVDLEEGDDDNMPEKRAITRWNRAEEILLAETWIEHSQDANIGKDQEDDVYWNMIMQDFNSRTTYPPHNLEELFGPDPRERPAGKQRAPKKTRLTRRAPGGAPEGAPGEANRSLLWGPNEKMYLFILLALREKTEYLRCDFGRYEVVHQEMDIRIGDQILQPKESFRYLGSVLHRSGRIVDDVSHRIRAEQDVDSIIDKMRKGMLRWFGHVKRRPQSTSVMRVEAMVVEGSKRRGRPKLRWELVCLPRVYDDVGCFLALVLFHTLPLSISLMYTYTGRRSPGSSLFTFGFILEVGV
nr:retrovirus-related Pol polyprotein LINE-1 [Tanacetum cinerariifolium]